MNELPLINDITALGLLALVLILGYYMSNRVFKILVDHLDRQEAQQDEMIELLRECLRKPLLFKESSQSIDNK